MKKELMKCMENNRSTISFGRSIYPNLNREILKDILEEKNLANKNNSNPKYHFYLSDLTKYFEKISKKFFGKSIDLELKVM